jgi:nucleotide-binding universal stress UspA family protein
MNETMKLLIAYDGSDCAEAALDDLRVAGLPAQNVDALVVAVAEVWLPPPPPPVHEVVEEASSAHTPAQLQHWQARSTRAFTEAEALARRAAERLRSNFPGWTVNAAAQAGSPAWELITCADSWRPDLLVVGSHGRTALGRLVLGSVSQKVLTEARCSVRIARGRVETEAPTARILVGLDGSQDSVAAVAAVAARVWPAGSEARLVTATSDAEVYDITPEAEAERARAWHEMSAAHLRAAGLSVSSQIEAGEPKRLLVEAAEAWGATSIFVGARGHGLLERLVLGSVSAAIAARARCSVEVVRPPDA